MEHACLIVSVFMENSIGPNMVSIHSRLPFGTKRLQSGLMLKPRPYSVYGSGDESSEVAHMGRLD